MKAIKVYLAAVAAMVLTGCTTYSYTSRVMSVASGMEMIPSQTLVDVKPDFSRRIVVTSSRCKSENEAIQEVNFKAIVDNKIDIVVDPIYKVKRQGRKYEVTLSGFAGMYANPRTLLEDIKQHETISKEDIEKYLMLQENSQILPYLYQNGDAGVVNIYHNSKEKAPRREDKSETTKQDVKSTPVTTTTTTTTTTTKRKK